MTRFDRLVVLVSLTLGAVCALLVWQSVAAGMRVVTLLPGADAQNVSTRSKIQITFDQTLSPTIPSDTLTFTPPLSGTLKIENKTLTFTPAETLAPETSYTVALTASLTSRAGSVRAQPLAWQFRTRAAQVIYLVPYTEDTGQLWRAEADGTHATQLTREPGGVMDYAVSPDGETIVYSVELSNGGTIIRRMDRDGKPARDLLKCVDMLCYGAVWTPDGGRLLYQKAKPDTITLTNRPAQLWWLDPDSGETKPFFEKDTDYQLHPQFSPNGQWLAYLAPADNQLVVYNLGDGTSASAPTASLEKFTWSPQSDALVYVSRASNTQLLFDYLYRFELGTSTNASLGGKGEISEHDPKWSPDGKWIAYVRSARNDDTSITFWQLWLMHPDGSDAHALTMNPDFFFTEPAWSSDSRRLLLTRTPRASSPPAPEVWVYDLQANTWQQIATAGQTAAWLP